MDKKDQPVHVAAKTDVQQLRDLLEQTPGLRDQSGWFDRQPIHVAAEAGRSDCLELLLGRGADPNAREHLHQQSPLHFAVMADSLECVDQLLAAGAKVNYADSRGETPIFYAKSRKVLDRLVDAGARLDVYSTRGQFAYQYCAAYVRSVEAMQFWIDQGVDLNHVPEFGWPALNAISGRNYGVNGSPDKQNDLALLQLLINHGADVQLCEKGGSFSLIDACFNWHHHLVEALLEAGADPNQQSGTGDTPLHAAVFRGSTDVVRLLLDKGADVNVLNRHHQSPYDVSHDKPGIRKLLEPHHKPTSLPLPTPDQVIRRLTAIPHFQSVPLKGCTEAEIDDLQQKMNVRFPRAYREFLARLGKGAGEFMVSDRWLFRFDEIERIEREEYAEFCNLPEDHFVFAERDGCVWVFLMTDGKSEDPPVYMFSDHESREYRQVARSVWEFIESLVIDYEIWYGTSDSGEL